MQLIDLQSGQPINIDTKVVTFAGEIGILTDATPPRNEGELGRVFFRALGASYVREMTPQVIGAKWTDGTEGTTTKGSIVVVNHNEHNGYYGGFSLVVDFTLT